MTRAGTPKGEAAADAARAAPTVATAPAPTAPPAAELLRAASSPHGRAIASEALFAGASEVHISHRGSLYRLKQTALGKLILTK